MDLPQVLAPWRDVTHPAAMILLRPSEKQYTELKSNIAKRGLLTPLATFIGYNGEHWLLDGKIVGVDDHTVASVKAYAEIPHNPETPTIAVRRETTGRVARGRKPGSPQSKKPISVTTPIAGDEPTTESGVVVIEHGDMTAPPLCLSDAEIATKALAALPFEEALNVVFAWHGALTSERQPWCASNSIRRSTAARVSGFDRAIWAHDGLPRTAKTRTKTKAADGRPRGGKPMSKKIAVLEAEFRALEALRTAHEAKGQTRQGAGLRQLIAGLQPLLDARESHELNALGAFIFRTGEEAAAVAADVARYWGNHRTDVDISLSDPERRSPKPLAYLLEMLRIAADTLVAAQRAERRLHSDEEIVSTTSLDAEIEQLNAVGNVVMPSRLQHLSYIPETTEFALVFDFVQHRSELADPAAAAVHKAWRYFRRHANLSGRQYLQGLLSHAQTWLPVTRHLRERRFRVWIDDKYKNYAAWQDGDGLIGVIDIEFDEISFNFIAGYSIRTREIWARGQPVDKWHWPIISHLGIRRLMPRAPWPR